VPGDAGTLESMPRTGRPKSPRGHESGAHAYVRLSADEKALIDKAIAIELRAKITAGSYKATLTPSTFLRDSGLQRAREIIKAAG
jgi:hypothetical protein